ncbi:hypothetical protein V8G54_026924 [Vigna mungo]|uniref:Uncharacterized protein n=1 Tax=Vigna mungo TaxID=3915 RepID=A0AAQ3MZM1_VIGMU
MIEDNFSIASSKPRCVSVHVSDIAFHRWDLLIKEAIVVDKGRGFEMIEGRSKGNLATEMVMTQIQVSNVGSRGNGFGYGPFQIIVGQIKSSEIRPWPKRVGSLIPELNRLTGIGPETSIAPPFYPETAESAQKVGSETDPDLPDGKSAVSTQQGPAQHSKRTEVPGNGPGEEVVTEIQVHETREVRERRGDRAGDLVVGEVKHREALEPADVCGDAAGDSVSDEGCDAAGDLAGDSLPVCDDDAGETRELADRRRDVAGHVASPVSSLEDRLLRLAAEGDVGDAVGFLVTAHTVPVVAAVGASPRVEDSEASSAALSDGGQERTPELSAMNNSSIPVINLAAPILIAVEPTLCCDVVKTMYLSVSEVNKTFCWNDEFAPYRVRNWDGISLWVEGNGVTDGDYAHGGDEKAHWLCIEEEEFDQPVISRKHYPQDFVPSYGNQEQ